MPNPLSHLFRNAVSTVQRFVSQASQPPPAAPPHAAPAVQQAYIQDAFQERARAFGGLIAGFTHTAPPIVGGAPPISSVEGLEPVQPYTQNPAVGAQSWIV